VGGADGVGVGVGHGGWGKVEEEVLVVHAGDEVVRDLCIAICYSLLRLLPERAT